MNRLPDVIAGPWAAIALGGMALLLWRGMRRPKNPALVLSCARDDLFSAWYMAHACLSWSALVIYLAWRESLQGRHHLWWVALILLAVGVGGAVTGIRRTRDWLRLGSRALHLDPYPMHAGGAIGGWLIVPAPYSELNQVSVTLRCEEGEEFDGGEGTETSWKDVWQQEMSAELSALERATRIAFTFQPPAELPASEPSKHRWNISLAAHGPGMSFTEYYPILVQPRPLSNATT